MRERRRLALAATVLASSASTVVAHHGVTGLYDTSRPIALVGTVTAASFSPPHPVISLRVRRAAAPEGNLGRPDEITGPIAVRDEDVGREREVEFSPVRAFYDIGRRVRVGDDVTIVALRNCRAPHQLRSSWIRFADGEVVSYAGGLHRRADGCPSPRS